MSGARALTFSLNTRYPFPALIFLDENVFLFEARLADIALYLCDMFHSMRSTISVTIADVFVEDVGLRT